MGAIRTIWHNPDCSKSRAALAILQSQGHPYRVRNYIEDPPDRARLEEVASYLEGGARSLLREKEAKELEPANSAALPLGDIIDVLAANPSLIQRPVVIEGERAIIARPPEVLEIWGTIAP